MTITPAHRAQVQLATFDTGAYGGPALVNPGGPEFTVEPDRDGPPVKGVRTLMAALEELDAAVPNYVEADEMYDGEIGDVQVSAEVARLLSKSGINDIEDLNYAKVPVDTIAEKLQIRAITCSAGDEGNTIDPGDDEVKHTTGQELTEHPSDKAKAELAAAAEEKIDDLRTRNQLDAEEFELHRDLCKYGDMYLFVWPVVEVPDGVDEDEDPRVYQDAIEQSPQFTGTVVGVDMFVNDPKTVRAFYDPENPLKMTHVVKSWIWIDPESDQERRRATLYFTDRTERWVTRPGEDPKRPESWVPYRELDEQGQPVGEWPVPNPHGRIPWFHFRTARTYGRPIHRPAYGPQRLINKLVGAHAVTIDYQSFPQRYALTDPKGDDLLQNYINPDNPEDDDDDPEGDGHSQLRADPAAVWKLRASQVGQFAAADPSVFMQPLDRYVKSMSELCGIPLSRFTGYSTPPSGESRRAENEPLYEKARYLQSNACGSVWQDAYEFALVLLGMDDITVTVQWKPVESAAGMDDWSIAEKKIGLGVPVAQVLQELGYPKDEVEKWLLDTAGADLVRRVALLNQIATAVTGLAGGISVGLLDPEQAGTIIAQTLGLIGEDLPKLEKPVNLHPMQAQQQMQLQNQQRNAQLAEHQASAPPDKQFDKEGRELPSNPPRDLPPPPPPIPPIKAGN